MTALPIGCLRGTSARGGGEGACAWLHPPSLALFLLRADPAEALDRERRAATFLGDLAVLLHDISARRIVSVEPAEQFGRHAPVGALGAVFINDIEKGKFAFGIGAGFLGHGGLSSIRAPLSNCGCRHPVRLEQVGCRAIAYAVCFSSDARHNLVMPGLVPGIHVLCSAGKVVDGRDEPGHDDVETSAQKRTRVICDSPEAER